MSRFVVEIPSDKLFFRIGEVARIVGVPAHVIRFWETEFEALRPKKSSSRHRMYRRRDVETLLAIKRLLYEEGYTIAGARRRLEALRAEEAGLLLEAPPEQKRHKLALVPVEDEADPLQVIHEELKSFLKFLDDDEREAGRLEGL
jgi:DNA-binding transcriptional MerR regulator